MTSLGTISTVLQMAAMGVRDVGGSGRRPHNPGLQLNDNSKTCISFLTLSKGRRTRTAVSPPKFMAKIRVNYVNLPFETALVVARHQ